MRKKLHIDRYVPSVAEYQLDTKSRNLPSEYFSFEYLYLSIKRELSDIIKVNKRGYLSKVNKKNQDEIIFIVDQQIKEVLEKHKRRPANWYNSDGRYRSAVIEMLNAKENAMAVPELSDVHQEWKSKHEMRKIFRQANRIVSKNTTRYKSRESMCRVTSFSHALFSH